MRKERCTPVETGGCILRIECDGLSIVGDGALCIAQGVASPAPVMICGGILWCQLNDPGIICDGCLEISESHAVVPPVGIGAGVLRLEGNDQIFLISNFTAKRLMPDLEEYSKKETEDKKKEEDAASLPKAKNATAGEKKLPPEMLKALQEKQNKK